MTHWKSLLICSLLGSASMQAAACYTVYDRSDRVVYQSETPPVDMSRPLHETLPARFPGGHLIFDTLADCPAIRTQVTGNGMRTLSSPLLTDRRTATSMGLRHTVVAGGVALVQPGDAVMAPAVTVVAGEVYAARRPSRDTIITEMRDPPMTVVQSAERRSASDATRMMGAGPSR